MSHPAARPTLPIPHPAAPSIERTLDITTAAPPRAFVIGHPVSHSRSPLLHGFWLREHGLQGAYEALDVAPEALPRFIATFRKAGFAGGNVTVPHKQAVIPLLDRVEPEAASVGAVNTVWLDQGALVGGNTDVHGFLANMDECALGWDRDAGFATILGAGGAARAIVYALRQRGLRVHLANRTAATAEAFAARYSTGVTGGGWDSLAKSMSTADVLINTTMLGMKGAAPLSIDLAALPRHALVADIVYVPLTTALLRDAAARGHRTVDGLGMLLHQAAPGFTHWFGATPQVSPGLRAALIADIEARAAA